MIAGTTLFNGVVIALIWVLECAERHSVARGSRKFVIVSFKFLLKCLPALVFSQIPGTAIGKIYKRGFLLS